MTAFPFSSILSGSFGLLCGMSTPSAFLFASFAFFCASLFCASIAEFCFFCSSGNWVGFITFVNSPIFVGPASFVFESSATVGDTFSNCCRLVSSTTLLSILGGLTILRSSSVNLLPNFCSTSVMFLASLLFTSVAIASSTCLENFGSISPNCCGFIPNLKISLAFLKVFLFSYFFLSSGESFLASLSITFSLA